MKRCSKIGALITPQGTRKIDWLIVNDYLDISYNGKLPMIVFSQKGWEVYKVIYADELYNRILEESSYKEKGLVDILTKVNREVIKLLLTNIGESKNIGFVRFLETWMVVEVKKVRILIGQAIDKIKK